MPKKGNGGWGVKPYQADLTDAERRIMRRIAADMEVPVGVLVGRAIRAYYADELAKPRKSKKFTPSGHKNDQRA